MTQLILNIEDKSILPSLRKILSKLNGVTICKQKTRKTGLEEAIKDMEAGRVTTYNSKDELFKDLGL
jgi:hypothetical protein